MAGQHILVCLWSCNWCEAIWGYSLAATHSHACTHGWVMQSPVSYLHIVVSKSGSGLPRMPSNLLKSIDQSIDQWINQSTNHSINQSINQSIDQSINQSINRLIGGYLHTVYLQQHARSCHCSLINVYFVLENICMTGALTRLLYRYYVTSFEGFVIDVD